MCRNQSMPSLDLLLLDEVSGGSWRSPVYSGIVGAATGAFVGSAAARHPAGAIVGAVFGGAFEAFRGYNAQDFEQPSWDNARNHMVLATSSAAALVGGLVPGGSIVRGLVAGVGAIVGSNKVENAWNKITSGDFWRQATPRDLPALFPQYEYQRRSEALPDGAATLAVDVGDPNRTPNDVVAMSFSDLGTNPNDTVAFDFDDLSTSPNGIADLAAAPLGPTLATDTSSLGRVENGLLALETTTDASEVARTYDLVDVSPDRNQQDSVAQDTGAAVIVDNLDSPVDPGGIDTPLAQVASATPFDEVDGGSIT
jgi:hypothetical protein